MRIKEQVIRDTVRYATSVVLAQIALFIGRIAIASFSRLARHIAHLIYPQQHGPFITLMSVPALRLNEGKRSLEIILTQFK